jgi:hypothetical protein
VEHLVRFTTAEGREGHHYADSLEDTLKFVERLRNAEEAQDVRVFRLREVPIEFRAYYKVELRSLDSEPDEQLAPAAVPPVPTAEEPAEPAKATKPLVSAAAADLDSATDHSGRRLFQRG